MNLADMLTHQARRRPGHPAIIDGARVITHGEFDPLVRRWAARLMSLGAKPGDVIGIALKDRAEHLVAFYAVARMGAIILPVDWRWTAAEKQRITEFFGADMTLAEPDDDIAGSIAVDEAWQEALPALDPDMAFPSDADAPVVLSLSSGTTGKPKGPALSHRQFLSRWITQFVTLTFSEHDRYLSATPLYFGGGRSFTMSALYAGATVVMFPPPYEPAQLVAAATEYKATTTLLVPTMLRRLLEIAPDGDEELFAGLRLLLSTGAILHGDERRAVMDRLCAGFINYYGSTEGGGVSVLLPHHAEDKSASVGSTVFATDVEIVDDEHSAVAVDEIGRIRYRGTGVADGFFRDEAASAQSFHDGWFYPGDLGRLDEDGFLYLAGRADDLILRGGVNIYPAEIEQILLTHDGVQDAVALGWPSHDMGEEIAAFVVCEDHVNADNLVAHCRENLAPYKRPREIFIVDAFPRSALGKVAKAELKARLKPL
jgi:long-chain acyl-CoA synthetase